MTTNHSTTSAGRADDAPVQSRIAYDELVAVIARHLLAAGASEAIADTLARNCAACERDGALSHGVFRVPGYLDSIRSGWADARATPIVERVAAGFIRIDAANGFAQPAIESASAHISSAIAEAGIAVVAIRDSHHFSALWPDLEPFALQGLIGMTMVTGGAAVIPRGAHSKLLGTNPFAFASPVAGAQPLIMDLATSSMSHGDLQLAARAGNPVPIGTGTGAGGRDTDDPDEILAEGGLLPFGGHKGAALSMMIELLASGLTGGAFSYRNDLVFPAQPRAGSTARTGQLLILIDPERGADSSYSARAADFVSALRAGGLDRLPADHRYRTREHAVAVGIPLTPEIEHLLRS